MTTISEFDNQKIIEFFEKFNDTSLSIQIDKLFYPTCSQLKTLGTYLENLNSLENLEINILENTILQEKGIKLIIEPLKHLQNLTVLTIYIQNLCIFESEGIIELVDAFKGLQKLTELIIKIGVRNIIDEKAIKYLVDNLTILKNLESLQLQLFGLRIPSDTEDSLKNFWEGLSKLSQIKRLNFSLNYDYIGEESLMNLFNNIELSRSQLTSFQMKLIHNDTQFEWFDKLLDILFQQPNLQVLNLNFQNVEFLSNKRNERILDLILNMKNLKLLYLQDMIGGWTDFVQNESFSKHLSLIDFLQIQNLRSREVQMRLRKVFIDSFNLKQLSLQFDIQDRRIYDELIDAICDSFRTMKSLSSLKLVIKNEIGKEACQRFRDSFQHLENLQSFYLNISNAFQRYPTLLECLKYLINLKKINVNCGDLFDYRMQQILLKNIKTLQNLQTLELQQEQNQFGIINIKEFSSTLQFLPNLQILNFKVFRMELSNQEIEEFQEALNTKNQLKQLNVDLQLVGNGELNSTSLMLSRMQGLIQLEIFHFKTNEFSLQFLADFSDSLASLKQLKSFSFSSEKAISQSQLINMLSALGCANNLQKLSFQIETKQDESNSEQQLEQEMLKLGESCIKLQMLQDLRITDRCQRNKIFSFYFFGISKLINLKILQINCLSSMENKDAEMLMNCFEQTSQLEILTIKASKYSVSGTEGDIYMRRGFIALQKLTELRLYFTISCCLSERLFFQTSFAHMSSLKTIEMKIYDVILQQEDQFHIPKTEIDSFINNQLQLSKNNIQLTDLDLKYNVEKNMDPKFLDQQLSFCNNLPYLYDLSLIISCKESIKFCLKSFASCINNLTKLNFLKLQFEKLNFSKSTYKEINNSLKNLSLLESFDYSQTEYTEHDLYLYEGMANLTNLTNLTLSCPFSMAGTIALGQSLMKMPYLLTLNLNFLKSSIIGAEGAISIGNGLSTLKRLKKLTLLLNSDLPIQEIGAITMSEGIEKLSKLQNLNIVIGQNIELEKEGEYKLAHCISDLSVLHELNLIINNNNNINQSFIEELVKIKQFKHLKKLNLVIEEIIGVTSLPLEFADIFNLSRSQIEIELLNQSLTISQGNTLKIQIKKLNLGKNLQFLRRLLPCVKLSTDSNVNLTKDFIESINNLISEIGQMQSKQLTIILGSNLDSSSISVLCENLSKLKHIESLCLEIRKKEPKMMITISQSLCFLFSLRDLKLEIVQTTYTSEDCSLLVKNLTKMSHLSVIYIFPRFANIDKLLRIITIRKMKRLVKWFY